MGRKSNTEKLIEGIRGQHLALSVAAHLARTQLVPDPLSTYDGQHISEMVDAIANELAKVAPLHVHHPKTGTAHQLTPLELEGAAVCCAATMLVLKDGRKLSSVSIKRADLRQAIAILKAVGVPGLRLAPPKETSASKAERPPLSAYLAQLESLLRLPLIQPQVDKANTVAISIARDARDGRVANHAMQLVSAMHDAAHNGDAGERDLGLALARLRAAVDEAEKA